MSFVIEGDVLTKYVPEDGQTEAIVPEGVVEIAKKAFSLNDSLSKVVLPESVRKIGDYAFSDCRHLSEINIPSCLRTLGDHAFENCCELSVITLPDSITELKNGTFSYCYKLTRIDLPNALTEIGHDTFEDSGLIELRIPDTVDSIGRCAFRHCKNLREVILPDGLLEIKSQTFAYCPSLEKVVLPASLSVIGDKAFYKCPKLAQITLPDKLEVVGTGAFFACFGLKHILIPASVGEVGDHAFSLCTHLELEAEAKDNISAARCLEDFEMQKGVIAFDFPFTQPTTDSKYCPFTGDALAVGWGIKWGDEEPKIGQEVSVSVSEPFCCKIGDTFSAISNTGSNKFFTARLLSVISQDEYSAEVRVAIIASGDYKTFVKPLPETTIERLNSEPNYYEDIAPFSRVAKISDDLFVTFEVEVEGAIQYENLYYTDENGIDHLVRSSGVHIEEIYHFFGDKVIGPHKNCPIVYRDGLTIHTKYKVLIDFSDNITDLIIPSGIEYTMGRTLWNRENLEIVYIPDSLEMRVMEDTEYAFWNCPKLRKVFISEKREIKGRPLRWCPEAEFIRISEGEPLNITGILQEE